MRGLDPRIHRLGKKYGKTQQAVAKSGWTRGSSPRVTPVALKLNQTNREMP
jgi:hypothetical protein